MELLLSRYRNLTVLLVVILAQVLLLAYQVRSNEDVRLIRIWSVTAITPMARILEVVRRNTIGLVEDYFILLDVREQNRKLNEESGRLKMENQFLRTELQTADRAQALQAFQSRTPSRTLPARVIANGTGANSRVVFIDRGSSSGILRGMAVVTPDGIVGKVLAVYPISSQVLLITDPTFAAGVVSQKNRIHGTLKGLGQSRCLVDYVENEEKVEVGEHFFTSGDDRVFPKGLPVGTVSVVRSGKTFKDIFIVPSGFQKGLEEVLIVLEGVHGSLPEAQEAVSGNYSVLPAPPSTPQEQQAAASGQPPSVLTTDADRLRERYKKIGEALNQTFGQPGTKPPDFNIDPNKPRTPATQSQVPSGSPPIPPVTKPKPATPEVAVPKPAPSATPPAP